MARLLGRLALAALILAAAGAAAHADRRVALVLANGAYVNAPPLVNAVRDGEAIRDVLTGLDFEVIAGFDLTKAETQAMIADYATSVRGADVALFFYAGHGMQAGGANYLVPVDAALEDDISLDFETVAVDFVLRQMSRDTGVRLVFLDACRDNPLAAAFAERSALPAQSGLAEIRVEGAGTDTLIAFATSPDAVAFDGAGANSPFSAALVDHLAAANTPLTTVMTRVTGDVYRATGGAQRPWINASLTGEIVLNPADAADRVAAALPGANPPGADTPPAGETRAAATDPAASVPGLAGSGPVFFDAPVLFGDPTIDGMSLSQLIEGKPLYSPVEGLPREYWDAQCSSCHQWTRDRLCVQGRTYQTAGENVLRLEHPYGARFKVALGEWARNECR
ncbi:caspase family protein [Methylobrevis albus]|nr:caspase domain-containing protein [Methylobrevis albus]